MSEVGELLSEIREELSETKLLYKGLTEGLIPVEKPSSDEEEAIGDNDEIAGEEELMEALG